MSELLGRMLGYLLVPSPELVAAALIFGAAVFAMALIHGAAIAGRTLYRELSRRGFPAVLSTPVVVRAESKAVAPLPPRIDPALIWRALEGANATVGAGEARAGVHTSSAVQLIDAAAFTYDRLRHDISSVMPVPPHTVVTFVKPPAADRDAEALRLVRAQKVEAA